jgi:hypothetical protein
VNASPRPISSRSIPNSCARTPIGRNCAWSRSPTSNEAAAIDPLARGIDLTPLLDLLVDNEDVLKVFHAGGQDVEIIYNLTGKTPHPIFDTQIAMMAVSQGEQIGYSNLVEAGWAWSTRARALPTGRAAR